MFQHLYMSTLRAPLAPTALAALLDRARARNRAAGISGLLVCSGMRLFQLLEGEEDALEATLFRIRLDPRHLAIVPLRHQRIARPSRPDQPMAFEWLAGAHGERSLRAMVEAMIARLEAPPAAPLPHPRAA